MRNICLNPLSNTCFHRHGTRSIMTAVPATFLIGCLLVASANAETVQTGTLARIAETKTISIGHREDATPFSYRNSDGKVVGYSTDICEKIADRIGKSLGLDKIDVVFVPSSAATRFVLVKSGKIDLECTTTTNTAERRQQVEFSYPHFITATRFVSKKSDNLNSIKDLAGRSVVSTTGTINVEQLQSLNRKEKLNISVMLAKQHSEAFAMVEKNKASAFVMDGILLAALVASSSDPASYVISKDTFGPPEPYGILMRKDDEAFKTAVNDSLRDIFTSGEIDAIYAKWFMSPVPPDGRNLNLPVSAELAASFKNPQDYND